MYMQYIRTVHMYLRCTCVCIVRVYVQYTHTYNTYTCVRTLSMCSCAIECMWACVSACQLHSVGFMFINVHKYVHVRTYVLYILTFVLISTVYRFQVVVLCPALLILPHLDQGCPPVPPMGRMRRMRPLLGVSLPTPHPVDSV